MFHLLQRIGLSIRYLDFRYAILFVNCCIIIFQVKFFKSQTKTLHRFCLRLYTKIEITGIVPGAPVKSGYIITTFEMS